MWPLFVVSAEPDVQIDLQFLDRAVQLLAKGDIVELVFDGAAEASTYAVRLRCTRHASKATNQALQ